VTVVAAGGIWRAYDQGSAGPRTCRAAFDQRQPI